MIFPATVSLGRPVLSSAQILERFTTGQAERDPRAARARMVFVAATLELNMMGGDPDAMAELVDLMVVVSRLAEHATTA